MRSKRREKNVLLSILLLFTVFLYGCGGSAGIQESTIRLEVRDVTTKAPLEDVSIILTATDPGAQTGNATYYNTQLTTDSRGKVVFSNLPPDRAYGVQAAKDGFQMADGANVQTWIPDITTNPFIVEQGKAYDIIGYMRRADSPTTGSIRGYVYDRLTGQPITNASVYVTITNGTGPDVIDTTNKPSKPGYYELNDIPSGQQTLTVVSPGYTTGTGTAITIPQGGTIDWDVNLDTQLGRMRMTMQAQPGEAFLTEYVFLVQVLRNGTEIVSQAVVNPAADNTKTIQVLFDGDTTQANQGPGIPVLPSGSTDTYSIKVISENAHMVNPANGLTGLVLRGTGDANSTSLPFIDAGTIVMAVEKGIISLTLYHLPTPVTDLSAAHTDANLTLQASQAQMLVEGAMITSRYTGESPDNYFHYTLEEVPVGNRTILVNFPGNQLVGGGDGQIQNVTVIKDRTTAILQTIDWTE